LNAIGHAVVSEIGIHLPYGVSEESIGIDGAVERINAFVGELQFAEYRIGWRGEITLELRLYR